MKGKIHWLRADGDEVIDPADRPPQAQTMRLFVEGELEYVWVLFDGERTCMVVNETGAIRMADRKPLPVNMAASKIYAAANGRLGAPDIPRIHGNAVLLEKIHVD
ncbi:hypothetical protein Q8F57_018430 [Paraburkholderia terrae]|uniref:hypothetical protein n=1 Tax=Paraburkholderia terrae TaxID=311230 RepID=UPI00296B1FCE|nr:hypothetical protein [Paraburkholderia terrae]MDW3655178.1 hypothetical protein [Paraburkholderia terrae]